MNANRYMRDSLRTADRSNMDRLKLECALGLCGEAGEVAEQVKKHFFHGHELDIPFRTFYVHPKNGCFLEALALRGEQLEKWNTRNA